MKPLKRKSGFTLLELLAVMGIMMLLMGISGAAYFGMSRGAALRGAETNVRSTLALARQYAATRRKNTYVVFWQDPTNAYYRAFVEAGRHVAPAKNIDDQPALTVLGGDFRYPPSLEGGEIFNLEQTHRKHGYEAYYVVTNDWLGRSQSGLTAQDESGNFVTWVNNRPYGWAIRTKGVLPQGIRYNKQQDTWVDDVVFQPDGTTPLGEGIVIDLVEAMGDGTRTIRVKQGTGIIEFD